MTIAVKMLEKEGRFPPLQIQVQRVVNRAGSLSREDTAYVDEFLSYRFSQSMLVPVDAFSFQFFPPTDNNSRGKPTLDELVREGDIVTVYYGPENDRRQIATGLVDSTTLVCATSGESFAIVGRDLLSQLEDQDAVSFNSTDATGKTKTMFAGWRDIDGVVRELVKQTRIADSKIKRQGIGNVKSLCATSPGESKLAALLRFIEPLNCLVWLDADGSIVIGRPNFKATSSGTFFVDRDNDQSNVTQMKVTKNAGRIPNGVLGIWAGAEYAQDSFSTDVIQNQAERCAELRRSGHILNKTVVVSPPDVSNLASGGVAINTLLDGTPDSYVKAYVKRMIARANVAELDVEVLVPGHCNNDGDPYVADTVYKIFNDRANVDEDMYCYAVDYFMDQGGGQSTTMHFCKLGTIVADADAP